MNLIRTTAACACLLASQCALADLALYDVDVRYRQEVYSALTGVLDKPPVPGIPTLPVKLELLPNGQILVDAPPNVHEQIAQVLEAIAARPIPAAPRVTLRYWVLIGSPPGADTASSATPPILDDLIAELRNVHGNLSFRVAATASVASESGQDGELDARPIAIEQRLFVQERALNAEIEVRFFYADDAEKGRVLSVQQLEVGATLERGEFLVLGESTIDSEDDPELNGTLIFVVHWPEDG